MKRKQLFAGATTLQVGGMNLLRSAVWVAWLWGGVGFAAEPVLVPVEVFARGDLASGLVLSRDGRTIVFVDWTDAGLGGSARSARGAARRAT